MSVGNLANLTVHRLTTQSNIIGAGAYGDTTIFAPAKRMVQLQGLNLAGGPPMGTSGTHRIHVGTSAATGVNVWGVFETAYNKQIYLSGGFTDADSLLYGDVTNGPAKPMNDAMRQAFAVAMRAIVYDESAMPLAFRYFNNTVGGGNVNLNIGVFGIGQGVV